MVTELGDDVWWYDLCGVNAYLVDDDGDLSLIDAGNVWDRRSFVMGLHEAGFAMRDVDRVLVTHFDFDHVSGLARLQGLDATVYVGEGDAPLVTGKQRPPWTNHKGLLQCALSPLIKSPSLPVEPVADGDAIGGFTAYHTPGHTPGHTVYVHDELDAAFLGDLVMERKGRLRVPPWPLNYDTQAATESLHSFVERVPSYEIAAMGHGVPFVRNGSDRVAALARS
jgi:glyoxylase-like metal-dependent hydrolase (beta-lactamase superfamily II)